MDFEHPCAAVAHVDSVAADYAPAAEQRVAYADYPVVAALHPVVAALDAPADGERSALFVRVGLMAYNVAALLSADCFFPYDYTSHWVDGD